MIYFVRSNRHIKIGYTKAVDTRLRNLQSTSPSPCEVLGTMPGGFKLERALHERFKAHRAGGEWFAVNNELTEFITANASPFSLVEAPARRDTSALLPVSRRALEGLGRRIRDARLRRRVSAELMSERVGVSRPTYRAIEQGSPSVSAGGYVSALFVLGLLESLDSVARDDALGRKLQDAGLGDRVRRRASPVRRSS